jgi:hypothetical protein
LFVVFSFDPFDGLSSFLEEDKQSKGSKEKMTNNRKGQKKRGQTIERVKRKEVFVHFSFDPFDYLSSLLLTLSMVCPLFFRPFRLFVLFFFDPFGCLSTFLLTLVKRKVDKQPKGSTEKRTSHRKGQKKRR